MIFFQIILVEYSSKYKNKRFLYNFLQLGVTFSCGSDHKISEIENGMCVVMKKTFRYAILLTIGVLIAGNVATFASAYPSSSEYEGEITYPLEITNAIYADLDQDGLDDDVIVDFVLKSPTGELCYFDAKFEMFLTLPSGYTYWMQFRITEVFVELPVTLSLYNTATESGWYDLDIFADVWGYDVNGVIFSGTVSDSLTFDPREYKDGGLPYGVISY